MKISIVIPTYNNFEEGLVPCIESIIKYTDFSKLNLEIVVVANGSSDKLPHFLKQSNSLCNSSKPVIRFITYDKPIGYTKATNVGIKYSLDKGSDIIILLNDDCQILESPKNRWIELLTNKLTNTDGIVGVHNLVWNDNNFLVFYCVAISKKVFKTIGLLDEAFNPGYGEDIDFCIKARNAGFMVENCDTKQKLLEDKKMYTGSFPLYHAGDKTVNNLSDWDNIKQRNLNILKERYSNMEFEYSIIIPTYNHLEDCLKPCLDSIIKYTDLNNVEIIVVSNGCTDDTDNYINSLKNVHNNIVLISNKEQLGYIKATNLGLKNMRGKYAILFNNDNKLGEQETNRWIELLRSPFNDSSVGITCPVVLWSYPLQFNYAIFFCTMISKKVIDEIGLLDESFGLGMCEDIDYCYRVNKNNYKIVQVPDEKLGGVGVSNMITGNFPIYHAGCMTFRDIQYNEQFNKNIFSVVMKHLDIIKLNIGCGDSRLNGYINIDNHPLYGDIHMDISDFGILNDNCIDEISAIHVLEHFHRDDTMNVLLEWNRILKRGGNFAIELPNIKEHCKAFVDPNCTSLQKDLLLSNIYGALCRHSPHLTGFDPEVLSEKLTRSNFIDFKFVDTKFHRYGGNEFLNMRCECNKKTFTRDMDIDEICNTIPEDCRSVAVEVGCFIGDSTVSLAKHFKKVIAVDMWKPNYDANDFISQSNLEGSKKIFYNRMKNYKNVEILEMSSEEASKLVEDGSVDFIYIDADHRYDMVKRDLSLWLPKVKDSGYISGHDYVNICGVPKAVNELFTPDKIFNDSSWIYKMNKNTSKPKVYDCVMFYNELELLKIRLNELRDVVDKFIIVECTKTHSNKPKPLYYKENEHLFSEFKDKIVNLVLDWNLDNCSPWNIESSQRDYAYNYLRQYANDDDVVIINDADEIVKKDTILNYNKLNGISCVCCQHHYYYLNYVNNSVWPHIKIGTWDKLKNVSFSQIRYFEHYPKIENGGWHFSFLGGPKAVKNKLESYAHIEYNNDKYNNMENILDSINNGTDIFHRDTELPYRKVDIDDSYPKYIQDNIDYYKKIGFISSDDIKILPAEKIEFPKKNIEVTATVSTKNRYDTTLPLCINSVIKQVYKPKRFIIFDDNDNPKNLTEIGLYNNMFKEAYYNGISVDVIYGRRSGQVANHQLALSVVDTDWIWRLDDDNIPDYNVLDGLVNTVDDKCAAVAGLVIDPSIDYTQLPAIASNDIKKIYYGCNIQWFKHPDTSIKNVDHLYSSFLFNRNIANKIGGYPNNLSVVGHREETIFTYKMKRSGYNLYVNPNIVTWHNKCNTGGIRSVNGNYQNDEKVFHDFLKECDVTPTEMKLFVLDCGLGDTFCFKHLIPEIKSKYKDHEIVIANCYPEAFDDVPDVTMMSIRDAIQLCGDIDKFNVYKLGVSSSINKPLLQLYRELYDI